MARDRIAAGVMGREEPGPSPPKLAFGIFPGQTMRQHQRSAVLLVVLPNRPGILHLLGCFWEQRGRQRHHPIISAFGPSNAEAAPFEVQVFDAQIERLGNPQSAAVEHPCDQVGRIPARGGPGPQGATGQEAPVQRGPAPKIGHQGQENRSATAQRDCRYRHSAQAVGLASTADCQQIRWQRQAITGPTVHAGRSARDDPENGSGESYVRLY
jgi:hypothetical protein